MKQLFAIVARLALVSPVCSAMADEKHGAVGKGPLVSMQEKRMKNLLYVMTFISLPAFAGDTVICPNNPNSSSRDYTKGCVVVQSDGKAYQTSPGSSGQDYSKPTFTVEKDGTVYQNSPNSSSRDWSKPTFKIEKK
jgi:hypothetical protein